MNLKALFRPSLYYDSLWELSARTRRPPPCPAPLSWTPDPAKLKQSLVLWPASYRWPHADKWMRPILSGLARFVPVEHRDMPQPSPNIVQFRLQCGSDALNIALDYADDSKVVPAFVERSDLYFKMQFHKAGYHHEHIKPGGFITNDCSIYLYLSRLRAMSRLPKRFEVYGRFALKYETETRSRALELLSSQQRFQFTGGPQRVRYSRFLRQSARSKICIDLPGHGCFCFRLVDSMALGACIVSVQHSAVLPVPLEHGRQLVFIRPDLSNLEDACIQYLDDDERRQAIADNALEYFDRYLHREQLAAYYLQQALSML